MRILRFCEDNPLRRRVHFPDDACVILIIRNADDHSGFFDIQVPHHIFDVPAACCIDARVEHHERLLMNHFYPPGPIEGKKPLLYILCPKSAQDIE